MKNNKSFALIASTLALAVFAGACQTTGNTNTAANANANRTASANAAANANSMAHDMSNMPMNSAHHDMSEMNHGDMKSDPNAASQPFDLQFIDTMSHHHQGAVEMAQAALKNSENDELKKFAQKIIDDQQKEINQMKEWREKWFVGKPRAQNMEMPGMMDSMKDMMGDGMKRMDAAKGKDFDLMFLDMMTPHHEGAIVMSRDALQKAEHPEIKTLANQIIKAQEAEIKQMADWKTKWAK